MSRQEFVSPNAEKRENPAGILSKVVIVRHGDSDKKTDKLNTLGKEQIAKFSQTLKKIKDKDRLSVLILSSPAPRAMESAEILAKTTGAPIERDQSLYPREPKNLDAELQGLLDLIDSKVSSANMLILVTHGEYCWAFPEFIGKNKFSQEWDRIPLGKGEGVIIDLKTKTIATLPFETN